MPSMPAMGSRALGSRSGERPTVCPSDEVLWSCSWARGCRAAPEFLGGCSSGVFEAPWQRDNEHRHTTVDTAIQI